MNREDIIRLAKEAGFTGFDLRCERLHHFAALVVEREREACAKLCLETEPFYGVMFADAIRARG
jgi:hypothetical protein